MKKTDYKSIFDYSGSVRAFVLDELLPRFGFFTIDVINLIPKDPDWQKTLIIEPDFTYIENEQKNFCVLSEEKYNKIGIEVGQTSYPEIDLGLLDLAGMLKLLQKRIFDPQERGQLTQVFHTIQGLRNTWSHESVEYNEKEAIEKTNHALNRLKPRLNVASEILIKKYKTDSNKTLSVFNDFQKYIEKTSKDFSVKVSRSIKSSDSNAITPRMLCNFNILVDETALMSKYSKRYISAITDLYNLPVIVCEQTIEYFYNCIRNNTEGKDKATDILTNTLTINKSINKKFNIIKNIDKSSVDSAEEIVGLIKNKMDNEKDNNPLFCVITEKKSLAKELWNLQKGDSLIVIHGKNDGTAEFFGHPENELNETPEKRPININVVFESAETADSNKDSSENTDTTKEPVITYQQNSSTNKNTQKQATYNKNTVNKEYKSEKTDITPAQQGAKTKVIHNPKVGDTVILDRGCFDNEKLKITGKLHSGGEGTIFEIEDYGSFVIKMYHKIPSEEQCNKLIAMVETYEADSANSFYNNTCCWPKAIVYDRSHKNILGYAMDYKKNAVTLDSLLTRIQLDDKSCGITRNELVNICIEICKNFTGLNNICNRTVLMGDINLKNILVTEDKKKVVFIDADSYQFKDYLCTVGTPDFTSPRLHKISNTKEKVYANTKRNIHDENFAIAVLIFYILFIKEFPFNSTEISLRDCIVKGYYSYSANRDNSKQSRRNYIYKNLTKKMQELFNDAFKNQKYIYANDWINPLTELRSAILSGKSSDELFPSCFLSEDDNSDCFVKKVCNLCKKTFTTAKSNSSSDTCQECLTKKMLAQSRIIRVTCSKCGAKFTTNEWDYAWLLEQSSSKNRIECPDCNPNIKFSKKGEFENSENFEKKLLGNMSYAFKNLKEKMP